MPTDCLPPHARSLPVLSCGERAACHECKSEIESLRGLLATAQADLAWLRAKYALQSAANAVLSRDLMEARAALRGPTP